MNALALCLIWLLSMCSVLHMWYYTPCVQNQSAQPGVRPTPPPQKSSIVPRLFVHETAAGCCRRRVDPLVYVYDNPELNRMNENVSRLDRALKHPTKEKFWTEEVIHEKLLRSPHRTMDPAKAELFFVPFYGRRSLFIPGSTALLHDILRKVLNNPWFHRHEGRDHFLVHSSQRRFDWIFQPKRNPFFRRMIMLTPSAVDKRRHRGSLFRKEKRFVVMPYYVTSPIHPPRRKKWLVSMLATLKNNPIRSQLVTIFQNVSRTFVQENHEVNASDIMSHSTFCLNPCGYVPDGVRFFESIAALCIPVVVCNDVHLPFEHVIDYDQLRIHYGEEKLEQLPEFLHSISQKSIQQYQRAIVEHRRALLYHDDLIINYLLNEVYRLADAMIFIWNK